MHTTAKWDPELNQRLSRQAKAANVRLHILVDEKDGLLNGERLRKLMPEWMSASIWFCGPVGFGKNLRSNLVEAGLPAEDFHQELFEMR